MNQKPNNMQVAPNNDPQRKAPGENPLAKDKISIQTKDKVEAAKNYIESNLNFWHSFNFPKKNIP